MLLATESEFEVAELLLLSQLEAAAAAAAAVPVAVAVDVAVDVAGAVAVAGPLECLFGLSS